MKETFTITFADGTTYNAILNGNNYIIEGDVVDAINAANKKTVTVTRADGTTAETYNNPIVVRNMFDDMGTGLVLRNLTPEEEREALVEARLSYLEMIGGV